jgi:hypothetical protein
MVMGGDEARYPSGAVPGEGIPHLQAIRRCGVPSDFSYGAGVSFELTVNDLTDDQGLAVETRCHDRAGWPVTFVPRHRRRLALFGSREVGPMLLMSDRGSDGELLLSDDADWDAQAWAMEPALLPSVAETVRILGEELPQGFILRATWTGSPVREEIVLTAEELTQLVLASQLNEFTRYRVVSRSAPV